MLGTVSADRRVADRRTHARSVAIERRVQDRRMLSAPPSDPPTIDYGPWLDKWHLFTSEACHHSHHDACKSRCGFCPAHCQCFCHRK